MDASMSQGRDLVDRANSHILARTCAGWGGTTCLIDEAECGTAVPLRSQLGDARAELGPATDADHYQVGDEVAHDTSTLDRGMRRDNIVTGTCGTDDERVLSDWAGRPYGRFAAVAVFQMQSPA